MTEIIPIITITCLRDLPLLHLQAQSISLYLDTSCPVYIIVNEQDPTEWNKKFESIKKYYNKHTLTVLYLKDFNGHWKQWIPSHVNPWAVGWETQQILKLAIAEKITTAGYLVLDSQNFLIRNWYYSDYTIQDNRLPFRTGYNCMPDDIWDDYSRSLEVDISTVDKDSFSTATPIFLHTESVKHLIDSKGGIWNFSHWFKTASRVKSEFILYRLWLEKTGGINQYHYTCDSWAYPYLRDSRTSFVDNINKFLSDLNNYYHAHKWASINHRSWGDLDDHYFLEICNRLRDLGLAPDFDEYRANYVDIKF